MSDEYIPMPKTPKRQYSGEYIGIVETGEHDASMRIQVRVKEIFTDDVPAADLPWAIYLLPTGSRKNDGFITPVKKGDYVWVDFPFGADTRRPRITGSVHYCPGSVPNFPDEEWKGPDKCQPRRSGTQPIAVSDRGIYPCEYKQNGICIEILRDGLVRVTHIESGSNIEIDKDGVIIIHAEENLFVSTQKNQENLTLGDSAIIVKQNMDTTVSENQTNETTGNSTIIVKQNMDTTVSENQTNTTLGNSTVFVQQNMSTTVNGNQTNTTTGGGSSPGDSLTTVSGNSTTIVEKKLNISSDQEMDAGSGVKIELTAPLVKIGDFTSIDGIMHIEL